MSATAYLARSPRYVFNPQDESLIRFAEMGTRGVTSRAVIRDLSTTGLAFCIEKTDDADLRLDAGDMLKIEFTIPGGRQIACFTTVMRVDEKTEWSPERGDHTLIVIALQFRHLPAAYLRAIQKGLEPKLTIVDRDTHLLPPATTHIPSRTPAGVFMAAWGAALLVSLYAMTLSPVALYRFFNP